MGEEPERLRAQAPHKFVERLDRSCEICNQPDRHLVHNMRNRDALLAEVERLAGERDKLRTQKRAWENQSKANHAKCERLAGRVAALTEALNDLDRWADGAEYGWYVKAVTETVLADVGGSE